MRRRFVPTLLRFEDVEDAGNDEEDSTNKIGEPVDTVEDALGEVVVHSREGHYAADVEDCGADGEVEGGEEADFVKVVGAEFVPCGPPFPFAACVRVLKVDCGILVEAVDVVVFAFSSCFCFGAVVGGRAVAFRFV